MKFLHLSDLHLGKRLGEVSLLDDQAYILDEIVRIAREEQPDAALLAGDIYDKSQPSAEAVALFDRFLTALTACVPQVFVISGNHDSPERLAFGAQLLDGAGVHLSPVYDGTVRPVTLTDAYGPVDIYLLPFLKPVHVRRCFPEEQIEDYTDALACAVRHLAADPARRSVLVTHQFAAGAARCESEELSIGGTDSVDASVFDGFDYVALGHLHGPQNVGGEHVRYCGTPLKYSFSETRHHKSVTIAELGEKGALTVRTVPLTPKRDMCELRGSYMELTARSFYEDLDREAYYRITLTDEQDVPDAAAKLRTVYPGLLRLDYDNARTRADNRIEMMENTSARKPIELFSALYEQQNGQPMTEEQRNYVSSLIELIWGDEA